MASLGHAGRHDGDAAASPWRRLGADSPDGWLGTRELPGYRAGALIVRLADLPAVDPAHLYLDVMRLGDDGHIDETLSGPCAALPHGQPLDARSRFVRVVAELLRHAADARRGLAGLAPAVSLLRDGGIDGPQLALAAQQLDAASSEDALAATLAQMLVLSLGEEEALGTLDTLLARLLPNAVAGDTLVEQVGLLLRCVGRFQARRRLREATDFELLPTPELLGL
ncbi:hypothetical protein [Piscinibacter sp.]|uniref:hypothetical protein n=1 Tax=Piscinibacter sp. TaxID=1903157 RepID=UPI0039E365AE